MNSILLRVRLSIMGVTMASGLAFWLIFETILPRLALPNHLVIAYGSLMTVIVITLSSYASANRLGLSFDLPQLERQRRALDFPFRLARLCFVCALGVAMAMLMTQLGIGRSLPSALVASVVSYLLGMLAILWLYLATRRILRGAAEGPPGTQQVAGIRQTIGMRLMFAIQTPIVASAFGIVLVDYSSRANEQAHLARVQQQQWNELASFVTSSSTSAESNPIPKSTRITGSKVLDSSNSSSERITWLPIVSLGILVWLTGLFGRWISRDITADLKAVGTGIRQLTRTSDGHAPLGSVGFRETCRIVDAFEDAVYNFDDQRRRIAEATKKRRLAEQQKSTFLTHISHELKSPLNSILGFSELMLAGIDGPLDEKQTARVGSIWLRGDSLLRFILGLIDLARIDSLTRSSTLDDVARLVPLASSNSMLMTRLKEFKRTDPRGHVDLVFKDLKHQEVKTRALYVDHTVRALLLAAGSMREVMAKGTIKVAMTTDDSGALLISIQGHGPPLESEDPDILHSHWSRLRDDGTADSQAATLGIPIRILDKLSGVQGTHLTISRNDRWPSLTLKCPRPEDT